MLSVPYRMQCHGVQADVQMSCIVFVLETRPLLVPPDAPWPNSLITCVLHTRDWEFSWLSRNLAPVKNQKIHWVSEPGSASLGLNVNNRGQIRFIRRGPSACSVSLTISYEVPQILVPFANVSGATVGVM